MTTLVVIPVYNHGEAVQAVVAQVVALGRPCLLVDDGSEACCAQILQTLAQAHPDSVSALRQDPNQGKGAAMIAGFREAARLGYSHVLQIDADGQHEVADIPSFLALSQAQPEAVICGVPQYDQSVPRARLYGRYATHVWVWINTLSLQIRDAMCGFRVYPLPATLAVIDSERVGTRMDFDVEILVRLYWRGVAVVNTPTPVRYPVDGVSHFRMWADNLAISRMHARLFFGMLKRWPQWLLRRWTGR